MALINDEDEGMTCLAAEIAFHIDAMFAWDVTVRSEGRLSQLRDIHYRVIEATRSRLVELAAKDLWTEIDAVAEGLIPASEMVHGDGCEIFFRPRVLRVFHLSLGVPIVIDGINAVLSGQSLPSWWPSSEVGIAILSDVGRALLAEAPPWTSAEAAGFEGPGLSYFPGVLTETSEDVCVADQDAYFAILAIIATSLESKPVNYRSGIKNFVGDAESQLHKARFGAAQVGGVEAAISDLIEPLTEDQRNLMLAWTRDEVEFYRHDRVVRPVADTGQASESSAS